MVAEQVDGVLVLPAGPAEVLEAVEVAAEVGALAKTAGAAQGVLQVGVNLDLERDIFPIELSFATPL